MWYLFLALFTGAAWLSAIGEHLQHKQDNAGFRVYLVDAAWIALLSGFLAVQFSMILKGGA